MAHQTGDEVFLSAGEAAAKMRVSVSTVYRLARSGDLRGHLLGKGTVRPRGLRIVESSVDDYLAASVIEPDVPQEAAA